MKRLLMAFSVVALSLMAQQSTAQLKGFRIGLGLEGALPSGDFANAYSVGGGLSARFEIRPMHNLALNATVGGMIFSPKKVDISSTADIKPLVNIPVKVGVKYIFVGHLYGMLEVGNTHSLVYYYDGSAVRKFSTNSFTYAPSIGVQLIGFDIGLRYETFGSKDTGTPSDPKIGTSHFTALRLGFGL